MSIDKNTWNLLKLKNFNHQKKVFIYIRLEEIGVTHYVRSYMYHNYGGTMNFSGNWCHCLIIIQYCYTSQNLHCQLHTMLYYLNVVQGGLSEYSILKMATLGFWGVFFMEKHHAIIWLGMCNAVLKIWFWLRYFFFYFNNFQV